MNTPRLPRKFKKRLVKLNGRSPVKKCLIIARCLCECGIPVKDIQNLANVDPTGWAVNKGAAEPFKMKY